MPKTFFAFERIALLPISDIFLIGMMIMYLLSALLDSNQGPSRYKLDALTNWAKGGYISRVQTKNTIKNDFQRVFSENKPPASGEAGGRGECQI